MAGEAQSETLDTSDRESQSPTSSTPATAPPTPATTPTPAPPTSSSAAAGTGGSLSDPTLSRNGSFSRLNARAPEFVPTPRPPPSARPDQHRLSVPPPPPPSVLHVYPPSPPFHMSPHMVAQHPFPHPHHPHSPPVVQFHHPHAQHSQYFAGKAGDQEVIVHKAQHHSHPHHRHHHHHHTNHHDQSQKQAQSEHDHGASSKHGLPDEAVQKILNQVEYYFSDLNLATTDHLMRFINKDPEGYVPLSVVASFKKIKALISSNSQLSSILQNSSKLVVSEDGKKVKRRHPLTDSDIEELQSRVIVAENLPEDHCYQNLMKVFSAVGSVKAIRTCQPQLSNGGASSASRLGKADGMPFTNKLHAFVEYESVELADKAVEELNDEGNWRSGLRVRIMFRRGSKPTQARVKKGLEGEEALEEEDTSTSEQQPAERQLEESSEQSDSLLQGNMAEDNSNDKEGGQRKGRGRGRGKGRGRAQYHQSNRGNHSGALPLNNVVSNEPPVLAKQPPGPRMPDGTRGFAIGRGKPVSVNTA